MSVAQESDLCPVKPLVLSQNCALPFGGALVSSSMTSTAEAIANVPAYMLPGVPVVQPAHLEGDPAFATEILPGPPPLVSITQSAPKRDPRKPNAVLSYLPASDPGSTYSGLAAMGAMGSAPDELSRRKRARTDKASSSTTRAQRASARHLNGTPQASDPPAPTQAAASSGTQPCDSEEPSGSRSDSGHITREGRSASVTAENSTMRRDKGKGVDVDVERGISRVKEEPQPVSLQNADSVNSLLNEDHCSACRSQGALVYCDGCPRAFHFWCLNPPMEADDLPEGDVRWFCPGCTMRKKPPPKPLPSFMAPLISQLQTTLPTEYQLPDDVRNFFKDVATGPKGAYVDASEIKQPRLNRHGQLEDRDPYRLKDRNGAPVLCFCCGMSALPSGSVSGSVSLTGTETETESAERLRKSSSSPIDSESWKSIVSCDHCNLHWHLDCLNPPLPTMPPFDKKWMCPNHADRLLNPKRRIPRHNAPPIEVTKPHQYNNGSIDIIQHRLPPQSSTNTPVSMDEVLINGRRYRVPEQVILLDFWRKVSGGGLHLKPFADNLSGLSSPLTSLSSLSSEETDSGCADTDSTPNDLKVAEMLCAVKYSVRNGVSRSSESTSRRFVSKGIQTDTEGTQYGEPAPVNKDPVLPPVPKTRPATSAKKKERDGVSTTKPTRTTVRMKTVSDVVILPTTNGSTAPNEDAESSKGRLTLPAVPRPKKKRKIREDVDMSMAGEVAPKAKAKKRKQSDVDETASDVAMNGWPSDVTPEKEEEQPDKGKKQKLEKPTKANLESEKKGKEKSLSSPAQAKAKGSNTPATSSASASAKRAQPQVADSLVSAHAASNLKRQALMIRLPRPGTVRPSGRTAPTSPVASSSPLSAPAGSYVNLKQRNGKVPADLTRGSPDIDSTSLP